jgi:hypothetical protein
MIWYLCLNFALEQISRSVKYFIKSPYTLNIEINADFLSKKLSQLMFPSTVHITPYSCQHYLYLFS